MDIGRGELATYPEYPTALLFLRSRSGRSGRRGCWTHRLRSPATDSYRCKTSQYVEERERAEERGYGACVPLERLQALKHEQRLEWEALLLQRVPYLLLQHVVLDLWELSLSPSRRDTRRSRPKPVLARNSRICAFSREVLSRRTRCRCALGARIFRIVVVAAAAVVVSGPRRRRHLEHAMLGATP